MNVSIISFDYLNNLLLLFVANKAINCWGWYNINGLFSRENSCYSTGRLSAARNPMKMSKVHKEDRFSFYYAFYSRLPHGIINPDFVN